MCVDKGLSALLGVWDPMAPSPFKCRVCIILESARIAEAITEDYKDRRDTMAICKDTFTARPWMADIHRPSIRSALLRVRHCLPPANSCGLADVRVRGSQVPSAGALLLLTSAQTCGAASRSGRVALGSIGRVRSNPSPHVKFKQCSGPDAQGVGRAAEYLRRVAKETDDGLARTSASQREHFREAPRALPTPSRSRF